ncbi:hypothetical protein ACEWY4_026559 [Coilia grayii]|uniref:Glycoprotein hormone subunit beta domain-containing protein n=1 Tax=Coilia grayii TaxID=363190 RepID=A0ABD1ISX6_9TELE
MQVVAMVVLWSLARLVAPECHSGCYLVNISIPVEMDDNRSCLMETQACAGMCENKDSVYDSPRGKQPEERQRSCHFQEWTYEIRHLPRDCQPAAGLDADTDAGVGLGADVMLTIPKALSCGCSPCDTSSYDCATLSSSAMDSSCHSHEPLQLQGHP